MRARSLGLTLALSATACLDLNTSPDTKLGVELVLSELNSFSTVFLAPATAAGQVEGQPEFVGPISGCPYDTASTFFTCPKVSIAQPDVVFDTLTRSYQLNGATAVALSAYDVNTVASARVILDRSNKKTTTSGAATTTYTTIAHADLTVSGLLAGSHTTNASGVTTLTKATPQVTTIETTFTLTNVATPQTPVGYLTPDWPNSGAVFYRYVRKVGNGAPDTVSIDLTFTGANGASYVLQHLGTSKPGACTMQRANSVLVSADCVLTAPAPSQRSLSDER